MDEVAHVVVAVVEALWRSSGRGSLSISGRLASMRPRVTSIQPSVPSKRTPLRQPLSAACSFFDRSFSGGAFLLAEEPVGGVGRSRLRDGGGGVGDAVGVDVFDEEGGEGGEPAADRLADAAAFDGDGAGVIQAEGPLHDVEMVSAPVGDGAFGVIPPPAEQAVDALLLERVALGLALPHFPVEAFGDLCSAANGPP